MDQLNALLQQIDEKKEELDGYSISPEHELRLWRKFRLDWNYNSNHMEGNTLTYGETQLLVIFGKTSGTHDLREFEEMKAHDVAIQKIRTYAEDEERIISESDIRELNRIILVEPFWKEAITTGGQATRKKIMPGEYKKTSNNVLLPIGEVFDFSSPEATPIEMADLMAWYKDQWGKLHAVVLAALFHYRFVRIHPFDDGNGRLARLLANYTLMRSGVPPVVIFSTDKKNYLNALNQADSGNLNAFVEYFAEQVMVSLNLALKAAKGEPIEEESDWEKELAQLGKKFDASNASTVSKNVDDIQARYGDSIKPFIAYLKPELSKFDRFFSSSSIEEKINMSGGTAGTQIPESIDAVFQSLKDHPEDYQFLHAVSWQFIWKGLKVDSPPHDFDLEMIVAFKPYGIRIFTNKFDDEKDRFDYEFPYNKIWEKDKFALMVARIANPFAKYLKKFT